MRRPRFRKISWGTVFWVALLWVLLWGDIHPGNILAGALIGVVVQELLPLPRVPYSGRIHPWYLLKLVLRFFTDLIVASFQVAAIALDPRRLPRGAVIGVQTRSASDLYLTLTAQITTLVPGSVVVEAIRSNGMLYVHFIDVDFQGGVEGMRQGVLATEARVMRAIASDDELAQARVSR
ncbi:MAG TPA: Na+/H+ antiporter subunit E [Acidimicrobiia bacterium]|jgi:multicomponent Na+:H+ antiporter subunit E